MRPVEELVNIARRYELTLSFQNSANGDNDGARILADELAMVRAILAKAPQSFMRGESMSALNTTLILADFRSQHDHRPHLAFHEAFPGDTIEEVTARILSGELNGMIVSVHSVHDGICEDVSSIVADKIMDAWAKSLRVSKMARDFVDYMGGELREEEAA